jgi:hypothetical protein
MPPWRNDSGFLERGEADLVADPQGHRQQAMQRRNLGFKVIIFRSYFCGAALGIQALAIFVVCRLCPHVRRPCPLCLPPRGGLSTKLRCLSASCFPLHLRECGHVRTAACHAGSPQTP